VRILVQHGSTNLCGALGGGHSAHQELDIVVFAWRGNLIMAKSGAQAIANISLSTALRQRALAKVSGSKRTACVAFVRSTVPA
jgi:hypothetical protein